MSFQDAQLQEEYRSDEDDIVQDFFYPCFNMCTEYNRCIEFLSINMLKTIFSVYDNFARGDAKLKIIAGYRFRPIDLDILTLIFSPPDNPLEKRKMKDDMILSLRQAFEREQIQLKIAIINPDLSDDMFTDKLGIFRDKHDNAVVYVGTSKESYNIDQKKSFETLDVYTSWRDRTRVEKKMSYFEKLWKNKVTHIDVYEFEDAYQRGYLKYWLDWAVRSEH